MRIAFFHELPDGGAKIAVEEIAYYLGKNHEIDLYYTDKSVSRSTSSGFKKKYFFKFTPKKWNGGDPLTRIYKDTIELFKLSRLHKKIASQLDSKKYDFVFVNASRYIESPFILRYLKTPKVFYLHDPHFRLVYEEVADFEKKDGIRFLYEKIHRYVLKKLDYENIKKADLLIANSKYTQNTTKKTYGMSSKVGYLGIDTQFFKPIKLNKKKYDVLYIGSKDKLDGFDIFEKVAKSLGNVIIRKVLKEEGWLTREKLRDLYRESKVTVCLGRNEPLGLIPLEAAACEVPVVSLLEGGYKETVIDKKTGFLVGKNNTKIVEKIFTLLNNKDMRIKMGINARENAVKKWDWETKIVEIEKILSDFDKKHNT